MAKALLMIPMMLAALKGPALTLPAVPWSCDPALTRLFTPARPQLGRYEVCTTERPLSDAARADWVVETLEALDALGDAGPYDRSALARLYGGTRAKVARGWTREGDRFESLTLISPYPDATLSRLHAGTMLIRLTIALPARALQDRAPATPTLIVASP